MSYPRHDLAWKLFEPALSIVALLSLCLLKISAAPLTQNEAAAATSIQPGKSIERSIAAGETQSYTLAMTVGQYAHITVSQRGVDVVVTTFAPSGNKLVEFDGPNGNYDVEPISILAETAGVYRLEVHSSSPKMPGSYELKLADLRTATEHDRGYMTAQKLFTDAKALKSQKTRESYQQACDKYEAVLPIWHSLNEKMMEAYTLHEVGVIYGDIGLFQKGLDYHGKATALYHELKMPRMEATELINTGWIYGELDDTQHRLETYDRAAEVYKTIGDPDPILISNLASTYARLGQYQRALDIHLRLMEMRRASQDVAGLAITLTNIGDCYERLGDKPKALEFYFESLKFMRQANDNFYTAWALMHIANVYEKTGENEKALDYLNQTLEIRQNINDQRGIAISLYHIAKVQRERGNLGEARKRIEQALDLVEGLRSKVASQQLRAMFFASVQLYREFYVDLLMRMHKENPSQQLDRLAFNASETGRARSLLELLNEANAEIAHGVDPVLLERRQSLGQTLADKAESQTRMLRAPHTDEQAAATMKEIAALTTEYDQVEAQIRNTSPRYAALIKPVPLNLAETQKQVLDPDTLLLEYSLGEQRSFLWAVTTDSVKTYELPSRAVIEPVARRVYEQLTAYSQNVPNETLEQRRQRLQLADADYQKAAASLSEMLLGPAAAELKNKRLLIVSDGVLQFIPFAGLPEPAKAQPLIVDHEIVTAPSTSVVALLRNETINRKRAPKTLAVLADPVFSNNDPRVNTAQLAHAAATEKNAATAALRSAADVGLGDLRRLRFSRQEADEITRLANDAKLEAVDFAANRNLATSADLGQYRIVHFATHGLINDTHPELSGIVLSLVDEKGQAQNGFLRLYDLYNLKLSADLVVLSACQTALGKDIKGEGLVGLTRGFMYAGAPRVVASLWQIDDRASAEFMKRFYHEMLVEKLAPAAALRAAQVSMLKDQRWNQPQYWAAFTIQGEWK
jgi:CHAT domain-containing protein